MFMSTYIISTVLLETINVDLMNLNDGRLDTGQIHVYNIQWFERVLKFVSFFTYGPVEGFTECKPRPACSEKDIFQIHSVCDKEGKVMQSYFTSTTYIMTCL